MAHAVAEHPVPEYETKAHMGMPLPNGKLAMWLFLVTEIMFFTGLIGTYIILRNGSQVGTSTTNTYTDNTVAASTGYSYTVEAVDAANNTSADAGAPQSTTADAKAPVIERTKSKGFFGWLF